MQIHVPVEAAQTFTTTGVHVEQAAATGEVTFSNYNPVSSNTIPAGSVVATEGGIRFKTLATISVPAGTFVLPNVVPARRTVKVQAAKTGPEGNVPANAIRVVPQGENPDFLKVTNEQPMTGGLRTETPEVSQAEVDKAIAALRSQLEKAFADAVSSGAGAPAGATLFPRTALLGDPTPNLDPKSLVGQAIGTYDLSLTADGTVIAVDPSPIRALAESQLTAKVGGDHKLVPDSVKVQVGEGSVDETGAVTFDATARGLRIAMLDPATLRALVKGKTASEAKAALARFGEVRVEIWPSWASTVTSLDARLNVSVDESAAAAASAEPPASAGTQPSRRPTSSTSPQPEASAAESAAP
jgi:baseplate J-like protein